MHRLANFDTFVGAEAVKQSDSSKTTAHAQGAEHWDHATELQQMLRTTALAAPASAVYASRRCNRGDSSPLTSPLRPQPRRRQTWPARSGRTLTATALCRRSTFYRSSTFWPTAPASQTTRTRTRTRTAKLPPTMSMPFSVRWALKLNHVSVY